MLVTLKLQSGRKGNQEFKIILRELKVSWVYVRLSQSNRKAQKTDAWPLVGLVALAMLCNL